MRNSEAFGSGESQLYVDDPSATYRGYRRQALYALYRLFDDALPANFTIQPEGNEDLAIYDENGTLAEVVQVKDYSDNLTASTFKPTFYRRIAGFCEPGSKVRVRIVSFGEIGPELKEAIDTDGQSIPKRVLDTLTKSRESKQKKRDGTTQTIKVPGLTDEQAKNVLRHLSIEKVDESVLSASVLKGLSASVTAGNPQEAFSNLMWWLLTSSEKQSRLDRKKAVVTLEGIGRFLTHRALHAHEWNVSIIPIEPDAMPRDASTLRDSFFRGGRVRFEHVVANLDVPRAQYLNEIHSAFDQESVVVVRAASGQGKTTIAYRYVLDFAPSDFRFEMMAASDLQHARRLAATIVGHSEAISVPTLIYIDVRPGDNLWIEIVRELASVPGIRVLVTIREEDWTRARVTYSDFSFAEIILAFDRDEARELYDVLPSGPTKSRHLDFDDAWNQFGERKTLFEFVYYVTQDERLADRVIAQIRALQDAANRGEVGKSEIDLLRRVAIASAYEARLRLPTLVASCNIAEPKRTLERFQNEYLLRTSDDGQFVEGFHSIRSELICAQLLDESTNPWHISACECLPILDEGDLESFLLFSFYRHPGASDHIVSKLSKFAPQSWIGVRNIAVALMWNGLQKYAKVNSKLIERTLSRFNSAWWITLDWDLAQVKGAKGFDILESLRHLSPNYAKAADTSAEIRRDQTDKTAVFEDVTRWLAQLISTPSDPTELSDFVAMSEVLFWIGHLKIVTPLTGNISGELIDKALATLPSHLFADFALSIQQCDARSYERWLSTNRSDVIRNLREQSGIMALIEEDDAWVAHYAIDLDRKASVLRPNAYREDSPNEAINDLSVERVAALSYSLPGKSHYGAIGYGHQSSLFASIADASIKRMPVEYIGTPWMPRFNALARGHVDRKFRPANWTAYFNELREMRKLVLNVLEDLKKASQAVGAGKIGLSDTVAWDECQRRLDGEFLFPLSAVDEWGFVTESSSIKGAIDSRRTRFSSISRLEPFRKSVAEYTRTVGSFLRQALETLILIPLLTSAENEARKLQIVATAKDLGVNENSIKLSVVNGFDACKAVDVLQRLGQTLFGDPETLGLPTGFLQREFDSFAAAMLSWGVFTNPQELLPKIKARKANSRRQSRSPNLRDLLDSTRNRIVTELKKLRADGIDASLLSDSIRWVDDLALWIVVDTPHPISSLVAIEKVWHALVTAFRPDVSKMIQMKVIDLYWSRIVLVPLVAGKSLERKALPNFKGVAYVEVAKLEDQLWRVFPEDIPESAWAALNLPLWNRPLSWDVFDRFSSAYNLVFHHVDHMADFHRCDEILDAQGEAVMQKYLAYESLRVQPLLQETLDACADLCASFPELDADLIKARPNILSCMQHVVEMKSAILPTADFNSHVKLTIKQIVEWRSRLKVGFQNLGQARYLWIADSLGLPEYK